ncbi:hypothetical protein SFRURICE_014255, partial [Spodoptera frugiperda]
SVLTTDKLSKTVKALFDPGIELETPLQRHSFYPRWGSQRCICTLQQVMPLYNVNISPVVL